MRLVGATNWYIRWPFLVEGVCIGLLGSFLACGILYFGYRELIRYLTTNLNFLPLLVDWDVLLTMGLDIVAYGGSLGLIGSFLSVFRYLRV